MKKLCLTILILLGLPWLADAAYSPLPISAEDSAHVDLENLMRSACRRIDTAASSSGTSGDWSTINCDATGRLWVNTEIPDAVSVTATGMAVPASAPFVLAVLECYNGTTLDLCVATSNVAHDSPTSGTNYPILIGGYANAAAPTSVSADLDAVNAWFLRNGAQAMVLTAAGALIGGDATNGLDVDVTRVPTDPFGANADASSATGSLSAKLRYIAAAFNPCQTVAKTPITINISTATTTEITPSLAGASTHYYICSLNLVTAAANNVALVDDDSDGCGSVTSGLAGGTTAASGWNFAANGGAVFGNGDAWVFRTAGTNRVVCLVTSAATQLSGAMTVVAAP